MVRETTRARDGHRHGSASRPIWQDQDLLTESDLAAHWQMSSRSLQRWRAEAYGPAWIVIGGSIRYRWADVSTFEEQVRHPMGRR